jgi:hypothetical protein
MVPHNWQQLCLLLTIPGSGGTFGCCTFCFEAPPAEEDERSKKQSQWSLSKVQLENRQKEPKEKVTKITNLPQGKFLGAGSLLPFKLLLFLST